MYLRNTFEKTAVTASTLWVIAILCGFYLWQERYFLRFLPIPYKSMTLLYQKDGLLPPVTPMVPRGTLDFPKYDLSTDVGLRSTLNYMQLQSPFSVPRPSPTDYSSITFESWIEQIRVTPFFCTDASLLFMLMAWQQGVIAREWYLLTPEWEPGQGHSIVEFYNPRSGKWIVVDPQHAGILRDNSGGYLDMQTLLGYYIEKRVDRVVVDYGPYAKMMRNGARGATTEDYLFKHAGLSVPVLNLRQPTWFATAQRNDVVIGYPIILSEFIHDSRVYATKVVATVFFLALLCSLLFGLKLRRKRVRGR